MPVKLLQSSLPKTWPVDRSKLMVPSSFTMLCPNRVINFQLELSRTRSIPTPSEFCTSNVSELLVVVVPQLVAKSATEITVIASVLIVCVLII